MTVLSSDSAAIVSHYWDTRAAGYGLQTLDEIEGRRASQWSSILDVLLSPLARTAHIADMGCGPGALLLRAAKMGFHCTGIDLSEQMLAQAKKLAQTEGVADRVSLVHANVQEPPLAANSLDVIMSRNLMWNLPQPQQALRSWLTALKPGGLLIIGDGNHYRWLTSERFRAAHDANPQWFAHDPRYLQGVATSAMDCLARTLPLTHEDRPDWDVKQLRALGAADICPHIQNTLPIPGTDESVPMDFVLTARKSRR